jgi:hypothetical protein
VSWSCSTWGIFCVKWKSDYAFWCLTSWVGILLPPFTSWLCFWSSNPLPLLKWSSFRCCCCFDM